MLWARHGAARLEHAGAMRAFIWVAAIMFVQSLVDPARSCGR